MRELVHDQLFDPPKGARAIVIPCLGESWDKGKTKTSPMDTGYAFIARTKWPKLHVNLGIFNWQMGAKPHPLTGDFDGTGKVQMPGGAKGLPPKYHMVSLPTRRYKEEPINVDFLCQQLRALALLCDGRIRWLAEGDIYLPQICDGPERPWEHWRRYAELYLPDRFVVISGKVGTTT